MGKIKTTLKLLPVCECGYIIRDLQIGKDVIEQNGIKYGVPYIRPADCPNCHKEIESIEWNDLQIREDKTNE